MPNCIVSMVFSHLPAALTSAMRFAISMAETSAFSNLIDVASTKWLQMDAIGSASFTLASRMFYSRIALAISIICYYNKSIENYL